MKRYKFIIKLSDGNEIQAASVGNSRDEAVERLLALPQTTEFIGSAQVIDAVLVGEEAVRPVPADRFVLQRATNPGWWVVGDPEGMFVIKFKEHDFNGTRKITYLKDTSSAASAEARVLREIPEWLQLYHSEAVSYTHLTLPTKA